MLVYANQAKYQAFIRNYLLPRILQLKLRLLLGKIKVSILEIILLRQIYYIGSKTTLKYSYIKKIRDYLEPKNTSVVRKFNSIIIGYKQYIKNYYEIVRPICYLISKKNEQRQEQAEYLASRDVLRCVQIQQQLLYIIIIGQGLKASTYSI